MEQSAQTIMMENAGIADVKTLRVTDLKKELSLRGLKVTGNKSECQLRLQEYLNLHGQGLVNVADGEIAVEKETDVSDQSLLIEEDCSPSELNREPFPDRQQELTPDPADLTGASTQTEEDPSSCCRRCESHELEIRILKDDIQVERYNCLFKLSRANAAIRIEGKYSNSS